MFFVVSIIIATMECQRCETKQEKVKEWLKCFKKSTATYWVAIPIGVIIDLGIIAVLKTCTYYMQLIMSL